MKPINMIATHKETFISTFCASVNTPREQCSANFNVQNIITQLSHNQCYITQQQWFTAEKNTDVRSSESGVIAVICSVMA